MEQNNGLVDPLEDVLGQFGQIEAGRQSVRQTFHGIGYMSDARMGVY